MATISQAPATLDIVAVKGDDLTITLTITENGTAYDWTGATVATSIMDVAGTAVATNFTTATPTNGTLVLTLTDTQTNTLGVVTYRWQVNVTKASATRTWLAGALSIMQPGWGGTSTSSASLSINTGAATIAITSVTGGTASGITITDSADYYVGTNVETVLAELPGRFGYGRGNTLIPLGDSLIAPSSHASWVDLIATQSGGRWCLMTNAGIGGQNSTQFLARLSTDVIAYQPAFCLVQVTGNDASAINNVATSIANYRSILTTLQANGIRPLLVLGSPSDTTATRDYILRVNAAMSAYCQSMGIPMLDLYTPLVDPNDGTYLAAYTSDGTHPNGPGVAAVAAYNATRVPSMMLARPNALAAGANDPFNLSTNPLFLTDTNSDGLSDSWATTGTATFSRTAVTAGSGNGFWQNINPVDSTTSSIYQDVTTVVGRFYELSVRVKCSGSGFGIRLPNYLGTANYDFGGGSTIATQNTIVESAGAIATCRFKASSTSSRIFLRAGGAVGTTSFAQVTVRDLTAIAALG